MKEKIKTVVGSVIYQAAKDYIPDFLDSLCRQTNPTFDILLINDNFEEVALTDKLKKYFDFWGSRLRVVNSQEPGAPAYILRIQLLKKVRELGYDLLILADCDDICSDNRVEKVTEQYDPHYAFFYNVLLDFDSKRIMPELPKKVLNLESILQCNFLGLTNTSINMSCLSTEFIESLVAGNTSIFDWYLFSRIVIDGGYGKKITSAVTYYQLHNNNLAGKFTYNPNNIKKELEIKKRQYTLLKPYYPKCERLLEQYQKLKLPEGIHEQEEPTFWWGFLRVPE